MDSEVCCITSFQIEHAHGEYYVEIIGAVVHLYANTIPITMPDIIRAISPGQVFMSCGEPPNTDSVVICTGFNRAGFPEYTWISRLGRKKFVTVDQLAYVGWNDEHWARDIKGNHYLMAESVILRDSVCLQSRLKKYPSPHDYYQANRSICPGEFPNSILGNFDGITKCEAKHCGSYHPCMLQYDPTNFYEMRITRSHGRQETLNGSAYRHLMDICGQFAGFAPLVVTKVKSRRN